MAMYVYSNFMHGIPLLSRFKYYILMPHIDNSKGSASTEHEQDAFHPLDPMLRGMLLLILYFKMIEISGPFFM